MLHACVHCGLIQVSWKQNVIRSKKDDESQKISPSLGEMLFPCTSLNLPKIAAARTGVWWSSANGHDRFYIIFAFQAEIREHKLEMTTFLPVARVACNIGTGQGAMPLGEVQWVG